MKTPTIVAWDGGRVAYDVTGTGPALILLHGGGRNRRVWHDAGYVTSCSLFRYRLVDVRGEWNRARTCADERPCLKLGHHARERSSTLRHPDGFTRLEPLGDASEAVSKVANRSCLHGDRRVSHQRRRR